MPFTPEPANFTPKSLNIIKGFQDEPDSRISVRILQHSSEQGMARGSELLEEIMALQELDNLQLLPSFPRIPQKFPTGAFGLVSPCSGKGNIQDYLALNPEADKFSKIHSVADILSYLHDNKIVHGNLQPSNILIDDSGSVALTDFGRSHIIDPWNSETRIGSVRYSAPEIIDGSSKHRTYKSDVYAFASVSIEILTGVEPFAFTTSDVDVALALYHQDPPHNFPEYSLLGHSGLDQTLWDLMDMCWNWSPHKRPDMHHICGVLKKISSILRSEDGPGPQRARL